MIATYGETVRKSVEDSILMKVGCLCGNAVEHLGEIGERSTEGLTDDVMGEYMLGLKQQSKEEIGRVCHD